MPAPPGICTDCLREPAPCPPYPITPSFGERAKALGYSALAITDECSMAGVVRAHVQAKQCGLKLLIGSQFRVECERPFNLVILACNLNGYGNLCEFITHLRRTTEQKGTDHL
ncbi:PHP domain-containing protein, partial [bacterium]|nr:PHP domain-containing protein [bacterium]